MMAVNNQESYTIQSVEYPKESQENDNMIYNYLKESVLDFQDDWTLESCVFSKA